jgi:hypothetical protein
MDNHLRYSYIYTFLYEKIFNNFLDLLLGVGIPFTIGTIKNGGPLKVRCKIFHIVLFVQISKFTVIKTASVVYWLPSLPRMR